MQNPRITQFFLYQVRKRTGRIHLAVADKIGTAGHVSLDAKIDSLYQILYINESKVLALEAGGEVNVLPDAFGHEEIIALAWSVYTGRTIDDIRKIL